MVSYSHADLEFTRHLVRALRSAGLSVWIDEEALEGGVRSLEAIGKAVCTCRCMVPVLSSQRGASKWCADELGLAYSYRKMIFPVSTEPFEAIKLSYSDRLILNGVQWENASGADRDARLQQLIDHIQAGLGRKAKGTRSESGREISWREDEHFWRRHFGEDATAVPWATFKERFEKELLDIGGLPGVNMARDAQGRFVGWVAELLQEELNGHDQTVQFNDFEAFRTRCTNPSVPRASEGGATFLESVGEFVHLETTVAYLLTQTDSDDSNEDIVSTLATLSAMPLASKRQFRVVQPRLLECLERRSEPDVVSMAALAIGRIGQRQPSWVEVGTPADAATARLLPLLEDDDRIVRASAALSCGMLRIDAAGERLAFLWRNDPIKDVRESALSAMRAVGGEVIERKLRVEKALGRHLEEFRVELERKSYQSDVNQMKAPVKQAISAEHAVENAIEQQQRTSKTQSKAPAAAEPEARSSNISSSALDA